MHLRSKTVQQLLSVILSVVMVLSMLPMEVLAQETPPVTTPMDLTAITEDTSGDGWSWTQSTKTLTLTGLTLTVSDDSTHALILPDGATIDLADGTTSTLTGGSRSTVYSSGEVKLRGSGSLTVYGRGWRSATLDMFIPGTLTDIAGLVIAVALLLVNVKKWEKGPKFIMDKHKAKQEQK